MDRLRNLEERLRGTKRAAFEWEFGTSNVCLWIDKYPYGGGLYVGIVDYDDGYMEPFADMTVNLPAYCMEENEAFICGDFSSDLIKFIKKYKLGEVLSFEGTSGYATYKAVAFDMKELKEFDPKGVEEYLGGIK